MSVKYAEDCFESIEAKQDNQKPYGQNPNGYGNKIAMPYLVKLNKKGRWFRVYCVIHSNVGSVYIELKKEKYFFRNEENLRTTGEWKK